MAELVKIEGRNLPKKKAPKPSQPSDLLQALRESAGVVAGTASKRAAATAPAAGPRVPARRK
ncbi:hypothetical protein AS026_38030 [Rhizobium altiplani]|uniref:Uncharacterized protein n=2 Tax=Rhizobium TaxID=379 RepID=K0PT35_9HYPH|nr:hypothetical protein AS026_38030 [Rhizobium altiplani]MDQ0561049.1 DNA end-binding protein Ku [Rhizobium mesoamericanum]CCM79906.1 conserved hypothetical protein [Rhizobium mesoamericanum STM3625]